MSEPEQVVHIEESPSALSRLVSSASYPASAVAGLFYWHAHVRDASYDGLKKVGDAHGGVFHKEWMARHDTVKDLMDKGTMGDTFAQARHAADMAYSSSVEKTCQEFGYTNIWKRFRHLEWNQKLQTVMTGITAAGITLGVMLTIADNKTLFERFTRKERKDDGFHK